MLVWYDNSNRLDTDARILIHKAMEAVEGKEVPGNNECVLYISTDGTVQGTTIKITTRSMNLLAKYDGEGFVGLDGERLMLEETKY